jgi:hypothetical protein
MPEEVAVEVLDFTMFLKLKHFENLNRVHYFSK